ncbi:sorbitol dehydrogenase-like [Aethina tumida]|uniref:sorbitol dehydrogenase-like n=1 Tax=Aethina tumida TaxID=116153 RepID=UPI002148894C|nr:sorbitol dehydrogenase-like [Aethina tumida]
MSKSSKILSAVLYRPNDLRLESKCLPDMKCDEVLLKMECVAIGNSDVGYFKDGKGKTGVYEIDKPMVLGYQGVGKVMQMGKEVTNLNVGDRVVVEPGVPCRKCDFCKTGKYNLCPFIKFCGTPNADGLMRQHHCHASDFCYQIPDCISSEEGALTEVLASAIYACKRGSITSGSVVCIFGACQLALACLMVCRNYGVKKILMVDENTSRLERAKCIGADAILDISKPICDEILIQKILCALKEEPDVCLELTGSAQGIKVGLRIPKSGGTFVIVGLGNEQTDVQINIIALKELKIMGAYKYTNNCFREAIDMMLSGRAPLKKLITHNYELEDVVQAFKTLKANCGNPLAVIVKCNQDDDECEKEQKSNPVCTCDKNSQIGEPRVNRPVGSTSRPQTSRDMTPTRSAYPSRNVQEDCEVNKLRASTFPKGDCNTTSNASSRAPSIPPSNSSSATGCFCESQLTLQANRFQ